MGRFPFTWPCRQRFRQTRQGLYTLPQSPAGDTLSINGNTAWHSWRNRFCLFNEKCYLPTSRFLIRPPRSTSSQVKGAGGSETLSWKDVKRDGRIRNLDLKKMWNGAGGSETWMWEDVERAGRIRNLDFGRWESALG